MTGRIGHPLVFPLQPCRVRRGETSSRCRSGVPIDPGPPPGSCSTRCTRPAGVEYPDQPQVPDTRSPVFDEKRPATGWTYASRAQDMMGLGHPGPESPTGPWSTWGVRMSAWTMLRRIVQGAKMARGFRRGRGPARGITGTFREGGSTCRVRRTSFRRGAGFPSPSQFQSTGPRPGSSPAGPTRWKKPAHQGRTRTGRPAGRVTGGSFRGLLPATGGQSPRAATAGRGLVFPWMPNGHRPRRAPGTALGCAPRAWCPLADGGQGALFASTGPGRIACSSAFCRGPGRLVPVTSLPGRPGVPSATEARGLRPRTEACGN